MTTKLRAVAPMAPKPHRVSLDNPHGTNWRLIATGIVTNTLEREAGFSVWAEFASEEGYGALYGYRHENTLFSYGYGPACVWPRGWSLWAN